jgi:hypothetical protein
LWIRSGSGGEEAVEVSGAVGWLDWILGKLGLISVRNLLCLIGKTLKTVHGKPFYKGLGLLSLQGGEEIFHKNFA